MIKYTFEGSNEGKDRDFCDSFLIFYWSIIYIEQKNKSKLMSFGKFICQCDLHS